MKKFYVIWAVFLALVITGVVNASAIKTWTTETLRYSDLNSNFEHIHNTMVGGHGARLVNSDVSASAAIAHSKLATPALVPKLFAFTSNSAACAADPCSVAVTSGITSINWVSTGIYTVNFAARANANYAVFASSNTANIVCNPSLYATTSVRLTCVTVNTAAVTNVAFQVMIMDND